MKIITKKELLNKPSGTVYARYIPETINSELHIKISNICNLDLIPSFEFGSNSERATNWSTDDLSIQADYDEDELFAVFNKAEVMKMINCLSWALCKCNAPFNMDEVYYEGNMISYDPGWMPH